MSKQVVRAYEKLRAHALSLPEAWEDHPWGESVVKVRKKIFVFLHVPAEGSKQDTLRFSVKLPASCTEVLRREDAAPMGYGLGRSGWVSLTITAKNLPKNDVLADWVDESYECVAPKKLARLVNPDL